MILRLLAEQVAIPLDQLARFLAVERLEADGLVAGLRGAGWVVQRHLLAGHAAWVWPTRRGARLSGTGFSAQTPAVRSLTHRRAVNEVRLCLAQPAPRGRWVCEREVERRLEPGVPKPDAVFEVGGERHAIEVELSRKSKSALRQTIASHSRRYEAVLYFCSPQTRCLLDETRRLGRWPNLIVRGLPALEPILATRSRGFGVPLREDRPPRHLPWQRRRKQPRHPQGWEREILRLISEQGAIPLDQLAGFLGCETDGAQRLGEHLCDAKFARRAPLLPAEPEWIWLSEGGTRLSQTGFKTYLPAPGALSRLRAMNEVRLRIEAGAPSARWIGWRTLRRELSGPGQIPNAVVEIGDERHAIEVELCKRSKDEAVQKVAHRSANYDAMICFCGTKARRCYARLAAENRWPKLIVKELTGSTTEFAPGPSVRWRHCAKEFDAAVRRGDDDRATGSSPRAARRHFWQPAENPGRSEVDDRLWAELEPLVASDHRPGPPRRRMPDRTALSGILYVARHDLPWNQLPYELGYGSAFTCLERLRRWERAGVWVDMRRLLEARLEDGGRIAWSRLAPQQCPGGQG